MKLTHYIWLRFIGITIAILLISVPIFYFGLKKIMEHNVDENLSFQKEWLIENLNSSNAANYEVYNQNIKINEVKSLIRNSDRYSTRSVFVSEDEEFVDFRQLDFYQKIDDKYYHITLRKSLFENEDILNSILTMQFGVIVILVIVLFFINQKIEQKLWKPFYSMLYSLKKYRIDKDTKIEFFDTNINEFKNLNTTFTDLIERNEKVFQAQKEFTENASHELQTPIAIIQSKLDMMYQTEPINGEQAKYLNEIQKANQKMSKLNKSLLLLAKIENRQFDANATLSFKQNIRKSLEDYEDFISEKGINLSENYLVDRTVEASASLLQILIGNLLSNAIKYTEKNGELKIELTGEYYQISNSSQHQKLDEDRLFKRFQKQSTGNENTGIGLEICKKICEYYQWTLTYRYSSGKHIFKVSFL